MKNLINLQKYWLPGELGPEMDRFVQYYNNQRYHESLDNVTPADVCYGRQQEILTRREKLKRRTLKAKKKYNLSQTNRLRSSLSKSPILSKKVRRHTVMDGASASGDLKRGVTSMRGK